MKKELNITHYPGILMFSSKVSLGIHTFEMGFSGKGLISEIQNNSGDTFRFFFSPLYDRGRYQMKFPKTINSKKSKFSQSLNSTNKFHE